MSTPFVERIRTLASRAPELQSHCATEEATKTALVLPFLAALGYDVFDPTEVVPEYVADVGIKKGEKIDYAIRRQGEVVLLVECKSCGSKLAIEHASQLYRYFSVTKARIAVLTNGLVYHFFSDLDEPNKLDQRPFLILDLLALRDDVLQEASKMAKGAFDLEEMLSSANALKYQREIRNVLEAQLEEPDEEFVKFFHARAGAGRFVQSAREQFTPLVRKAFSQLVSDRVSERLRTALASEGHEGELLQVRVFARGCEAAALQLDRRRIGLAPVEANFTAVFNVTYAPGTLEVKCVNGTEVVPGRTTALKTAGAPAALVATPDRAVIHAPGQIRW